MLKQKEETGPVTEYRYGSDVPILPKVRVLLPKYSQVPPAK
jgi:hypothetical protein